MSEDAIGKQARRPLLGRLLGREARQHAPAPRAVPALEETPGAPVLERLEAIERRLGDLAGVAHALAATAPAGDGQAEGGLQQALAGLEKQINRAGREQLKANSLVEAQVEQLGAALEVLRAAEARGDAELAALREQQGAALAAARLEVVRAVLPALDGLDEALRSGNQLLEQREAPPRKRRFFKRLRRAPVPSGCEAGLRDAMQAWLVGLTFVRRRLLDVLAAEQVVPMGAQGAPFDPRRHVALEVVPDGPDLLPGTVAAELRRGYMVGDRVLRHAEVAVAKEQRVEGKG